jgi:dCMP deaminase
MIIGVTGTKASGKGVIAEILGKNGFTYSSLSDCVRDEAESRGIKEYSIADLQDIGNEMREKQGDQVWATRALEKIGEQENYVLDGIRNPGEIDELRKRKDTIIIGVNADQKVIFERLIKRARQSDPKNWEGFIEMEKRDQGEAGNESGQQVRLCMAMVDYIFWNNYVSKEELGEEFIQGKKGFMNLLAKNKRRPTFHEISMLHATDWAKRSTCLRRQTGAITFNKESRIPLTQGYNGAARGLEDCVTKGYCERERRRIPSGERLEICRAAHAEANAVYNAAREGIKLKGQIMFATNYPCKDCANAIVQAGLEEVIYLGGYSSELSKQILEGTVKVTPFSGVMYHSFDKFWPHRNFF